MISIAIDGPAGSGKSSISKIIAEKLNIVHVDTGAMYRAIGVYAKSLGIASKDEEKLNSLMEDITIDVKLIDGNQHVFVNNQDLTDKIRTKEAGELASDVGTIKSVREKLVLAQRELSKKMSVIMDGRDIGTNVLKDADVKIYLDATADERAKRRLKDILLGGSEATFEEIKEKIIQRDYQDKNRKLNPLTKADDAILLDTTNLNLDEVVSAVLNIVSEKIKD